MSSFFINRQREILENQNLLSFVREWQTVEDTQKNFLQKLLAAVLSSLLFFKIYSLF